MTTTQVFFREATIELWAYFKRAGVYVSPDQGVKITVTDSQGAVKVDAVAMSENVTGKYVYYYTPASDAAQKDWSFKALGQHGTGASAKYGVGRGMFCVN